LHPIFYLLSASPVDFSSASRHWHQQADKCLHDNEQFVRAHRNGFRVYAQRTPVAEAALAFLLPDPDRAFVGAHILKPGSRTHAGIVEIAGKKYVLKRYNCRGWGYRLGNAFRRSRAVRTWLVNWEYLVREIPVPEPLVCLEERRCRLLERSYILMEFVDSSCSLRERWSQADEAERVRLGEYCGQFIGKMHRLGMLHGDLKWDNILVAQQPAGEIVRLVDLDGSTTMNTFSWTKAAADFSRFLKDLAKEGGDAGLIESVRSCWEKALR